MLGPFIAITVDDAGADFHSSFVIVRDIGTNDLKQ